MSLFRRGVSDKVATSLTHQPPAARAILRQLVIQPLADVRRDLCVVGWRCGALLRSRRDHGSGRRSRRLALPRRALGVVDGRDDAGHRGKMGWSGRGCLANSGAQCS